MDEIWKDVIGYEGDYQISNFGNVKSLKFGKERIMKGCRDTGGYPTVFLSKEGKYKNKVVHQLVAIHFLNHKPCGYKLIINHKNFIRHDNRVENLEIVTTRENSNRKHIKSSSQYVGVCWRKDKSKWDASIVIDYKRKHLGYFINEIDAHNAYQKNLKR